MNENSKRHGAARMFLSLAGDQAAVEQDQRSPIRKAGILFLVLLFVAATPLYWVGSALGHDSSDAPTATASSNSGPGGGDDDDDDDSSGPGSDGDGDSDDSTDDGDA